MEVSVAVDTETEVSVAVEVAVDKAVVVAVAVSVDVDVAVAVDIIGLFQVFVGKHPVNPGGGQTNPLGTLTVILGVCTGTTIVHVEYSEHGARMVRAVGRG